ncbi:MAG: spermidine/putrescine ABC transporter permease [Coxiella sp. RIFCSPHIGHO2_12_FULL_42_15]|nr:MAG: spermidine/putrescine ABC transporter permease [Coxiella sp. RIFCSPHIGHO2_12_FULL_42_15]
MAMRLFRNSSITLLYLWLGLFAFIPLLLVLMTSFLSHTDTALVVWHFSLKNYLQFSNPVYFRIFVQSLGLAFLATLFCLIIGYPAAYLIAQLSKRSKNLALLFIILPFWTSSLIRTYAMLAIIKTKGLLNTVLLALGIVDHPLQLLYSNTAVLIGSVYDLLPFMILPLFANIDKLDKRLLEAARNLGAGRFRLFTRIILPLTLPGIIAGSLLVFLPTMTLFYIPTILGGAKSILLGNLIQNQFLTIRDWPGGAATSVVLTVIMLLLIALYRRFAKGKQSEELLV